MKSKLVLVDMFGNKYVNIWKKKEKTEDICLAQLMDASDTTNYFKGHKLDK